MCTEPLRVAGVCRDWPVDGNRDGAVETVSS